MLYLFLIRKGNVIKRWKKLLHLLVKLFFFFFLPKIRKNKNANFSGHVIPAKSDPSNHFCRIKKSSLGLQCVQELSLLWHVRFTTFKNQSCKTRFFHEMSVEFAEQSGTYWEIFQQVYAGMKSLQFSRLQVWKLLNSTENHIQICKDLSEVQSFVASALLSWWRIIVRK